MMLAADYVIDMGPKAGRLGGEVVFAGTPQEMLKTCLLYTSRRWIVIAKQWTNIMLSRMNFLKVNI